jgi:mannitol/fructose-specific phosphotransferase system IIA component (Ntr-type)
MGIKLLNFTGPELVLARLPLGRREDVVRLLSERLVEEGRASDAGRLTQEILAREAVETTGIGGGLALPHARSEVVLGTHVCVATLAEPVPWNAIDGEPVDLVFLLVGNRELPGQQLRVLARISKLLRIASLLGELRAAESPAQIIKALQAAEARHF